MIIKDEHITEAENLLINGNRFDSEERIPFIKNLSSCDLLAVPGSGKTTALLAKLYCISKQLPFDDGSGILVLSHTNAAVDEIENNLKKHCPNLFTYPNFIGTVQSFVNRFFVIPYYSQYHGNTMLNIDDNMYYKEIERWLAVTYTSEIVYYKNNDLGIFYNSRFWYDENENLIISEGISNEELKLKIPKKWIREKTVESKKRIVFDFIKKLKVNAIRKGVLHYDDCYYIANEMIKKQPHMKELTQKRFKYIFIDEMQDLEKFQIDIIDKIFFEEGSLSVIQRIGDINQSIYSSGKKVKVEADWVPRNQMYLKDSNRLTQEIANVVNYFTLDRQADDDGNPRFVVNGLRPMDAPIKPHIVLFDNASMNRLEGKFKELIMSFSLQETSEAQKYGFNIIGWNAKWDDNVDHSDKLRLENIFESYKKETKSNKETYDSLSKYLQLFDHEKNTLEAARKALLNALIHVLRIEGKTYIVKIRGSEVARYYSKDEMIKFIKNPENNCDYEYFKKLIFLCAYGLAIRKRYDRVYNKLKEVILNKFKTWFDLTISTETLSFLGDNFENIIIDRHQVQESENQDGELKIDIGTVHSAKGQTHCATMYVETAYQRPTYDSCKVIKADSNPFLHQEHKCNGKFDRQALKMMYVGFSRPTHLLCFACLKENIADISSYQTVGWEVIDLTHAN